MMIECPECSSKVSSNAPACPRCGNPLKAQTVEQTSKKWKMLTLIGGILLVVGLPILIYSQAGMYSPYPAAIVAGLGLTMYLVARFGAWWYHA